MPALDHAVAHTAAMVRMHRRIGTATRRRVVPRARPPFLVESDYAARLVGLIDQVREQTKPLLAALPDLLAQAQAARHDARRHDVAPGNTRIASLLETVRHRLSTALRPSALDQLARQAGVRTSIAQRHELARQVRAGLGIDLVASDVRLPTLIDHFAMENVALVTSLGNKTLDDLAKVTTRAFTTGQTIDQATDEIAKRFGIAERHARLIARDQIGSLNSAIAASRHQDIGIDSFEWSGMMDDREREEHVALEGKVFTYASGGDPQEGLPGQAVCCRCGQTPVFASILDAIDDD